MDTFFLFDGSSSFDQDNLHSKSYVAVSLILC